MKQRPEIQENVELEALNTLHVPAKARFYVKVHTADELVQSLNWAASEDQEVLILGGGSNLVFAGDFSGLVVRLAIRGRRWEHIEDHKATLVLGAGENWHEAVLYATRAGYRGIENLALIPGTAGAAPVQNMVLTGSNSAIVLNRLQPWTARLVSWSFSRTRSAGSLTATACSNRLRAVTSSLKSVWLCRARGPLCSGIGIWRNTLLIRRKPLLVRCTWRRL